MTRYIDLSALSISPGATVGTGQGTDIDTGEEVLFAVDHRCADALVEALREEPTIVAVEEYAVLWVTPDPSAVGGYLGDTPGF